MTKIPDTLDSAQNDGHQAFQLITYFHMIHKYLKYAEVANYNIKKTTLGTKTSKGLQWGGSEF